PFAVALEPVVGDRLPFAGVVDERVPLGPDPMPRVEESESHASDLSRLGVLAPERAAAHRAEALGPAVAGGVLRHELIARQQAERSGRETGLDGCRGPRSPLAPRAVAIAGALRLLGDLETDAAA